MTSDGEGRVRSRSGAKVKRKGSVFRRGRRNEDGGVVMRSEWRVEDTARNRVHDQKARIRRKGSSEKEGRCTVRTEGDMRRQMVRNSSGKIV
ncbi:hypothetical protein PHLCEN_2v6691 [Hermanssonia centrifuga]|uniref:Uncharacterized protein n=1 Tax=Hermanssonia centrifuga TaxID=98765 RepID=A0A2R6NYP3_9APHY|nr:hypothetical protein PHLCEN_2v6691 [Hermanssonia centrifuga]